MKRFLILFLGLGGAVFAQTIPPGGGIYNLSSSGGGGGGSGTVTIVSFTGGIVSVANPTTTPAFTVAGTSGGVPYFSSTSTWASSGLLAANAILIGGGAGSAPASTTTAAGILTFIGSPTSANLAAAVTNETGTGLLVFATDPTFTLTDITTNNATTVQHGWLPKLGGGTTNFLRADGSWAAPGGAGTVTVVSSGSLTSTALVTGGGTTTLQTPSATATMDSSGNISTPGTLTVGNAATTAGAIALTQGTTQSTGTTNITIQAPAAVTSYIRTLPGAVGSTGFLLETVSGSVQTETLVAPTGSDNVVRATNPTVQSPVYTVAAVGASAIDWNAGDYHTKTLSANTTFTFSNAATGKQIVVAVTNTASNYTVTWPTVSWSGGTPPTQTVGAKTDIYTFIQIGSTIYGSVVQNF